MQTSLVESVKFQQSSQGVVKFYRATQKLINQHNWSFCLWNGKIADCLPLVKKFKLVQPCKIIIEVSELLLYYWGKLGQVSCLFLMNKFNIICFKFWCIVQDFLVVHKAWHNLVFSCFSFCMAKVVWSADLISPD